MRITNKLPIKKYSFDTNDTQVEAIPYEDPQGEYIKALDLDKILESLAKPEILNKLIKSIMFGTEVNIEEILKLSVKE